MILHRQIHFSIPGDTFLLQQPSRVFSGRYPFGEISQDQINLKGFLKAKAPILGEIDIPFEGTLEQISNDQIRLLPTNPDPAPKIWAQIQGNAWLSGETIKYEIELVVNATLGEAEKWGGKALLRMAEASFENALNRSLAQFQRIT